ANVALDELNVPENDRYILLPPWVVGMIKKADLKDASLTHGDPSLVLGKGRVGMIDRSMVYSSNTLTMVKKDAVSTGDPPADTWHVIAGQRSAISFASQIVKTETLRLQDSFGDAIRGLNVYGYKVTKEDALV